MSDESTQFKQTVKDTMRDVQHATRGAAESGRGVAAAAQETIAGAGDNLRKAADKVGHVVSEGYDTFSDKASQSYEYVRESVKSWESELESIIKERPLVAALASVGIGVVIGMLLHNHRDD
ncbi:MAG: hypothetical protein H7144_06455 [Burkholderiales bacterium]|nr:hypothetical protein [Phycisphaerae bacterium]